MEFQNHKWTSVKFVLGFTTLVLIASRTATETYSSCYGIDGEDMVYTGSVNVTKSNYSCQRWSSQTPHGHDSFILKMAGLNETVDEAGNACRPSPGHPPWCYTTNPDIRFDYCNIPRCHDPICGDHPKVLNAEVDFCERDGNNCTYKCIDGTRYIKGRNISKCKNDEWEIPDLICAPTDCYINSPDVGILYSGNKSTTWSGRDCQLWTVDVPHTINSDYREESNLTSGITLAEYSNYCRGYRDGKPPWCYTMDDSVEVESCDVPKCAEKINCSKPPDLVDAIPSGGEDLGSVVYTCKDGFNYINGTVTSRCMENGHWSLPGIFCAPTACKYNHHKYKMVYDGDVNETISGISCQNWSLDYPHTRSDRSSRLESNVVDKSLEEASNYCRGNTDLYMTIWCYTTNPNIRWDMCDIPTCEIPDCGEPPEVLFATPQKTEITTYPESVPYTCISGYSMMGEESSITCQKNGQWSQPSFRCEVIACAYPPIVLGAVLLFNATNHGHFPSVVYYKCLDGYKYITGNSYSTCRDDGMWSEADLLCAPTSCYNVDTKYGVVYAGTLSETEDGDICQMWSRDYPHTKFGPSADQANYNVDRSIDDAVNYCRGFVDESKPWCFTTNPDRRFGFCNINTCREHSCGPPPSVNGAILLSVDHTYLEGKAKYSCKAFTVRLKGGNGSSVCQAKGTWSTPNILCAPTACYRTDPVRGNLYAGKLSVTYQGIGCQRWDSYQPHIVSDYYRNRRNFLVDKTIFDASNYCRAFPNDAVSPWCYTVDPMVRWALCNVEKCQDAVCSQSEFECPGGRCIPQRWRCDGTADCSDLSDENNCTACSVQKECKNTGKPRLFETETGQCCDCPPGLTGTTCEDCDSSKIVCYNNGTLITRMSYGNCMCNCTDKYEGSRCAQTKYEYKFGNDTEYSFTLELPKLEKCLTDPIDFVIIVDGNILTKSRKNISQTVQKLLGYFGNDRVGLLTFNTKTVIQIDNKLYTNEEGFFQSLDRMKIERGNVSLADALTVTLGTQMTLTNGKRPGGLGITIIIATDLKENDFDLAAIKARVLRKNGIHTIVLDLANIIDFTGITESPKNVFHFDSVMDKTASSLTQRLALTICKVCDATWTYYRGSCYKLFTADEVETSIHITGYKGVHWINARRKCADQDSHLVTISDAMEESFLKTNIVNMDGNIFIGLKRTDNTYPKQYQDTYRWVDGKPPTYLKWNRADRESKEPDGAGIETCVTWSKTATKSSWMDVGCGDPIGKGFVCETNARNNTEKLDPPFIPPPAVTRHVDRLHNCSNGEVIWESRKCDRHPDCFDKSDEENCDEDCNYTQFRCLTNGQCISLDFYCDLINDCFDKSDELACIVKPCASYEWRCSDSQCISINKVCDLTPDCRDGSDEMNCNSCKGMRCYDGTCIPYSWQCDGIVDCPGSFKEDENSDVCQTIETQLNTECHWKAHGVYNTMTRDLTGLNDCATAECDFGYFKCPQSYCIPVPFVCNDVMDCIDGADEQNCENYQCPGYFKCRGSRRCIELKDVCDDHLDCPDGDDEMSCDFACPSVCDCVGSVLTCTGPFTGKEIFGCLTRKLDVSNSDISNVTENPFLGLHMLVELRMSKCYLQTFQWNVRELKNLMFLDLSDNDLRHIKRDSFSGLISLRVLDLSKNTHLKSIDIGAFHDLNKLVELRLQFTAIHTLNRGMFSGLVKLEFLNMSFSELIFIEDRAFENQGRMTTLDLHQTKITDFGEDIFLGLDDLHRLRAGIFTLCCPQVRPDSVEAINCFAPHDDFSSCKDLMQNDILRAFMWILGTSALIGNVAIIIYRLYFDETSLLKGCGYFILNLGFSDFFMGVYLLFIGTADIVYRGKYLWFANEWKQSAWCKAAGFLSTLSSEASTMFICLITLDRFLVIQFPFGKHFNKKSYLGACVTSWLLAFAMAMVPLLPATRHWNLYGRNSVCLALPLSRNLTPGWQYSTAVFIGFNLLAFTFIAAAQVVIYRAVKSTTIIRDKKRLARERSLARKLTLVVATDFICWFPVCVMGLAALGGIPIAGEIYTWTAVFILPVNSALNPFLYTLSSLRQKRNEDRKASSSKHGKSVNSTELTEGGGYNCYDPPKNQSERKVFVGCPKPDMHTLSSYLQTASPLETAVVMAAVFESLPILHKTNKKHDELTGENIFIGCLNKDVDRICFDVDVCDEGNTLEKDLQHLHLMFHDLLSK